MFCQFLSTTSQNTTNGHLFTLSFIELRSKTCRYQDTTSNNNCCAQISMLILNTEADTENMMTHYLHLNSFKVNPSLPVTYKEKQPHHLTELYSHMQYNSMLGWKSSYKSVPANTKLRNTSVYSMHTAHMKQNIAAITECGGCGGLVSHSSSSGSTNRTVRVCRTVHMQRYAQSGFSCSIYRQARVLLQMTWVIKQAHPNEQTFLF